MSSIVAMLALGTLLHDVMSFPMDKRILLPEYSVEKEGMYKILNGEPAQPGEYPYAVSLEIEGQHFCGGSVVSKYWVVSAAHCFPFPNMRNITLARVGTTKQGIGGSVHKLAEIILHPKYNEPTKFNNDIALIKMKDPFELGNDVTEVKLANSGYLLDQGVEVESAGWGVTTKSGDGGASPDLLKVKLQIVDRKKCKNLPFIRILRQHVKGVDITNRMICARSEGHDTTQGDSGGPLLRREENGEVVLVGIVSWGEGQGDLDSPGVYTDVAKFEKWIYKTMHPEM